MKVRKLVFHLFLHILINQLIILLPPVNTPAQSSSSLSSSQLSTVNRQTDEDIWSHFWQWEQDSAGQLSPTTLWHSNQTSTQRDGSKGCWRKSDQIISTVLLHLPHLAATTCAIIQVISCQIQKTTLFTGKWQASHRQQQQNQAGQGNN